MFRYHSVNIWKKTYKSQYRWLLADKRKTKCHLYEKGKEATEYVKIDGHSCERFVGNGRNEYTHH